MHLADNHASTSPLTFYRSDALPDAQPTVSKHWRQKGGHSARRKPQGTQRDTTPANTWYVTLSMHLCHYAVQTCHHGPSPGASPLDMTCLKCHKPAGNSRRLEREQRERAYYYYYYFLCPRVYHCTQWTAEGSVLAPSACGFCLCMKYHGRRVWSLAWMNLKVKLKGQRSPGTKNGIFGPFGGLHAVYVW